QAAHDAGIAVLGGRPALHRLLRPDGVGAKRPRSRLGHPGPRPPAPAGEAARARPGGSQADPPAVPRAGSGRRQILCAGRRRPAAGRRGRIRRGGAGARRVPGGAVRRVNHAAQRTAPPWSSVSARCPLPEISSIESATETSASVTALLLLSCAPLLSHTPG